MSQSYVMYDCHTNTHENREKTDFTRLIKHLNHQ